jgi:hypothetical protein
MPPAEAAARFIFQPMNEVWHVVTAVDRFVHLPGEQSGPGSGRCSVVTAHKPVLRMVVVRFGRTCVPSSQPLDRA